VGLPPCGAAAVVSAVGGLPDRPFHAALIVHPNGTAAAPPAELPLARLVPLLDIASLVRGERELRETLDAIAETISDGLGWRTVVINLYRPAWDDFQVTTVHGSEGAEQLLGATSQWSLWRQLLAERFHRRGAYLMRQEDIDAGESENTGFVPRGEPSSDPNGWDPEDGLMIPLAHSDGHLLGVVSVDEPQSGRHPTDEELDLLTAVATQVARAVEHVQRQGESRRAQAALEHLHEVSARLTTPVAAGSVLEAVAQGISRALGFQRVCVLLRDGEGFVPAALAGWDADDPAVRIRLSLADFERLLDHQFELEGSYLLEREEAVARCSTGSEYASRMNGRGPWAWNRHWLLTPLYDDQGELSGFIWADDPNDRLLPSRERLRVLRLFANHAQTALALARTFAVEHETNEMLRASITASPLAIFGLDRDAVIRSWNPAAERLYGWKAEELIGQPFPLASPERRLEFEHLLRSVLDGRSFRGLELVREARDGRHIEVSASAAPLRDASGGVTGAIILHEDITERKRAERQLERRHRELAALHGTTLDLIESLDEQGVLARIVERACELLHTEDGYVCLVEPQSEALVVRLGSGACADFIGIELQKGEGVAGRVWESERTVVVDRYMTWEGRSDHFEHLGFHSVTGVPLRSRSGFIGVLGIAHRDGTNFTRDDVELLERFGRLAALALENARLYTAAQRELDERREAESALSQSQELYRRVLETSTDSITLFALDGTVVFASRANESILGYTPDELQGRNFTEFIHPDDLAPTNAVIARALATGESAAYTARVRHKDGHWVLLEGKPAPVRNAKGEPELVLGMARDVTDRHRSEERGRELEEQLRQSQKLEAVGSLAGGIAHDFNNLLTAIAGYGGLALAAANDDQAGLRSDIQEMLAAAERARQLIRQLLAFSRKQVLQPRVLDLNAVIGNLKSILVRLIGEEIELVLELEPALGQVSADPGQIEQVLMNLCINARDAMTGGGRLVIETSNAGSDVALRVSDDGHGMTEEVQARIFEPFFTTKEEAKGTGLGLSTVYGIVQQSGGSISCESMPGEGTTFTVHLPRVDGPPDDERPAQRTSRGLLAGFETVLLAEDEQLVRQLVAETLERLGYSVLAAANGADALEQLDAHDGSVDLLLTDVVMPGMSGRELAELVRRRRPEARVLFMTGYAEDAVATHGVLQPGAELLEKPFTTAALGARVRAVLDSAV
jgi:two-component system cell cycle sensor histidine kinase/response regulator CckA